MSEINWMVRLRKASSLAIMSAKAALSRWMSPETMLDGQCCDDDDPSAAIDAPIEGKRADVMLLMSRVSISASNWRIFVKMGRPSATFRRIAVEWFKVEYLILSKSVEESPVNPVSVLIVLWISPFLRKENMFVRYCMTGWLLSSADNIEKHFNFFSEKTVRYGRTSIFSPNEKTVPLIKIYYDFTYRKCL